MKITQKKFDEMKANALGAEICHQWRRHLEGSHSFDELIVVSERGEPYVLHEYAHRVLKGRFKEGEATIAKDAYSSYLYARYVVKGRFLEGEEAIAKNPECSYQYAYRVLKGGFKEGEATIAKDAETSYGYAQYVLKGRFLEGEEAIAKSFSYNRHYNDFLATLSAKGKTKACKST